MGSSWTFTLGENKIARLVFDMPGEKVNKFTEESLDELKDFLLKAQSCGCALLIISSSKPGVFIAGADINEIKAICDHHQSQMKLKRGQEVFDLLDSSPFPTVALIDGACMGGGMELALACTERWMSIEPHSKCALPEVQLGVLPGWGGTQRLPNLVGLRAALDMIVTGRAVDGRKAQRMGLVDRLFSPEFVDDFVAEQSERLMLQGCMRVVKRRSWTDRFLDHSWLGAKLVFHKAHQKVEAKGADHYPALKGILHLLEESRNVDLRTGLKMEREAFGHLITGPVAHNLIQVFFNSEAIKKKPVEAKVDALSGAQVGIVGAGTMGGGIAWLLGSRGHGVCMKDLKWEALHAAYQSIDKINAARVKRRKMKANEAQMLRSRIGASVEKADFSGSALVIEAVLEQMEVKQRVLTEIEAGLSPEAILCSNTSALSITEMGAHLKHPERFAGLHFFNPVDRMPLVEIIAGEQTSNETVACLFATVKKLGKSPVVVKDVPGFLVNRILLSYMNEAARCLADGAKIDQVDQLICSFGMPMGPFELTDEVGIPVGYHVAETLYQAYGERMEIAKALDIVHKDMKMMGKRAGFGFYNWYGQEKVVNPRVESKLAPLRLGKTMVDKDIVDRCLFIMLKEAALCLEEGVVASASHLDMAMMLGTGFPPFRGGVLRYLDQYGLSRALDTFKRLEEGWGERFCPPQAIVDRVQQHRNYYGE